MLPHCAGTVLWVQKDIGLCEVFAVTTTKCEFQAAVDALNAAGIACHSPTLPKRSMFAPPTGSARDQTWKFRT